MDSEVPVIVRALCGLFGLAGGCAWAFAQYHLMRAMHERRMLAFAMCNALYEARLALLCEGMDRGAHCPAGDRVAPADA